MLLTLLSAPAAGADYGFSLFISPELHVQPGNVVNMPARILNTGTVDISFGTGYAGLAGQFNGVSLKPGEHADFAYLSISVYQDAAVGASDYQHPILGIAFPDGSNLLAASYTDPADSSFRTRVIVDTETYALPLTRITQAQLGYFTPSTSLDHAWIVMQSITEMAFANTQYGPDPGAMALPIRAVPEPATWLTMIAGLALAVGCKRKSHWREGGRRRREKTKCSAKP